PGQTWPTGTAQQPPFAGYQPPVTPPRSAPRVPSRAPWILGGLAAVNVLVLIVGATLFFVNHQSSGAGPYTTAGVDNACDLVDPTPLDRWEDQREKVENEEVERKNRTADG